MDRLPPVIILSLDMLEKWGLGYMHHLAGSYEQTPFKPHVPGHLSGSRNVPHDCHITKTSGAPVFPICGGCKLIGTILCAVRVIFLILLWYIYVIEIHRTESIRLLTGKLISLQVSEGL